MVGRLFAQSSELYTDIMLAQFEEVECLLENYQELFSATMAELASKDKEALMVAFNDVKDYFSYSVEEFLVQSQDILNKANDGPLLD